MAPCVAPLGFGMAYKVEDLNISFPYSLSAKNLMDWHGGEIPSPALVQVFQGHFEPFNVFLIIRHSVQPIPQRSIGSFQKRLLIVTYPHYRLGIPGIPPMRPIIF